MALIDILEQAQGGQFFESAGNAAGVSAADARSAIEKLARAIAEALHKRAKDEDAYDRLLDVLEDNDDDFLESPAAVQDQEAISDGMAILTDIYGTEAKALKLGKSVAPGITGDSLQKLMAISACAVLAALVHSNRRAPAALMGAQPVAGNTGSGGGLLGSIFSAVVAGVVQGASRSLARKTTARYRYGTRSRRKKTTRRRTSRPSLESIFGELLGLGRR